MRSLETTALPMREDNTNTNLPTPTSQNSQHERNPQAQQRSLETATLPPPAGAAPSEEVVAALNQELVSTKLARAEVRLSHD